MSPDGTAFAFGTGAGLFLHTLSDDRTRQLVSRGVEGSMAAGTVNPVFSPDGRWLAFFDGSSGASTLRKVAVSGGAPVALCGTSPPYGASWSDAPDTA